jgi:ADP-ribose pyrophosphatase
MRQEPLSEELVLDSAIFSVHRETWPGADHPYDVIRHVGAAWVLPMMPDGDVILVRQLCPGIRQALVEIPAELLDQRGEDALSCATCGLLEETGYRHAEIDSSAGRVRDAKTALALLLADARGVLL